MTNCICRHLCHEPIHQLAAFQKPCHPQSLLQGLCHCAIAWDSPSFNRLAKQRVYGCMHWSIIPECKAFPVTHNAHTMHAQRFRRCFEQDAEEAQWRHGSHGQAHTVRSDNQLQILAAVCKASYESPRVFEEVCARALISCSIVRSMLWPLKLPAIQYLSSFIKAHRKLLWPGSL